MRWIHLLWAAILLFAAGGAGLTTVLLLTPAPPVSPGVPCALPAPPSLMEPDRALEMVAATYVNPQAWELRLEGVALFCPATKTWWFSETVPAPDPSGENWTVLPADEVPGPVQAFVAQEHWSVAFYLIRASHGFGIPQVDVVWVEGTSGALLTKVTVAT